MNSISLLSPAKLNLFLKVVNKRPDGYHNLITLFERINLCDVVTLRLNHEGDIRVFCHHPDVPLGPKNLGFMAARLLKEKFSLRQGVHIHIKKRIPVASGLGGGSSNAATVFCGLNKLWRLSLGRPELLRYAKEIGSDVPFFLYDCSWAIGIQRGDAIKELSLGTKLWHVLVVPRLKVYSHEIFARFRVAPRMQLTKKMADVNMLPALRENDLSNVSKLLSNDLESTVTELQPQISKLTNKIRSLSALGVCLSGSGPAVFGLTESQRHAEQLRSRLAKIYKQVFVVRTL